MRPLLEAAVSELRQLAQVASNWYNISLAMGIKQLLTTTLAINGATTVSCNYTKNGLTWSPDAIRMNQIQVVGSHNSYHIETPLEERQVQKAILDNTINYWYSHPQFDLQLSEQRMRNLEIDVLADPEGGNYAYPVIRNLSDLPYDTDPVYKEPGTKVLHVPDADIHTVCHTLVSCLGIIKAWLDAHPKSVPIPIMMEFKVAEELSEAHGGAKIIPWDNEELLSGLDEEIRSVFPDDMLITPDDIRREELTLEESILKAGWPDLDSARGRIFFLMDNGPDHPVRHKYREDRPNLEGRVLFTNSAPGNADCAFQKLNEPRNDETQYIRDQVLAGYWVRTRADIPMDTVLDDCSTEMRDAAFRSGAQIVSTDFQAYGMSSRWGCDYAARLDGGRAARCNPVNGKEGCDDKYGLEPEEYRYE